MKLLRIILLLIITFCSTISFSADQLTEEQRKRNILIGHMLSKQLPSLHYSNKDLDNELSQAAFGLYLKQLDYQKRFLLQDDVDTLESFAEFIDDNMKNGRLILPDTGYAILTERISQAEKIVEEIIASGVKVLPKEEYEGDPEKLAYVKDLSALKERWRKIIKAQVMSRFLDLEEEWLAELKENPEKGDPDEKKLWQEAIEKVAKQNRSFFHRLNQETLQDHYDRFFNSVTRAFGPHTNYIPPASKEQFDINMRGSLEGIGAMLREEDGLIKVVRIIPGSASARQGQLSAEDTILAVAQEGEEPVDITDMRLRDAVRLIRGPKGSKVRLTVRKVDGAKQVITIIREVVQMEDTFVKSTVIETEDKSGLGYINIPSFYRDFEKSKRGEEGRNSTEDTRAELLKLIEQGVDGIILDLRNNGGGALVDAVDITGLFIDEGPVVQVKTSLGGKRVLYDQDEGVVYDGPLVVLVNEFSASASEIVAAALQDYGRAVIMGSPHTHGKGSVQTILDLNDYVPWLSLKKYEDLGALKIMIQKFYRVDGGSTQYKGVEPDIVMPSLYQHLESGEKYLEYSLPWDSIEPVPYEPFAKTIKVDNLRARSLARIELDDAFNVIREEALAAEKRSQDTTIYLDLEKMRSERKVTAEAKDRISEKMHTFDEEEALENEKKSDAEKKKIWEAQVSEDPYVLEAGRVIKDMKKTWEAQVSGDPYVLEVGRVIKDIQKG